MEVRVIFLSVPILDDTRYPHANRRLWTTQDFSVSFLSWVTVACWTQECELDLYCMGWEL